MDWVLSFSLAAGPPILYESIIVGTNKGQPGIEMWNVKRVIGKGAKKVTV